MKKGLFFLMSFFIASVCLAQGNKSTFTNPLLTSGADPWTIYHDGYYYYMQTMGNRLVLWKTKNMAHLRSAEKKTIWTPPKNTAHSKEIWAPEIHFIRGKWYVYFAADDGQNDHHRMYVVENKNTDPMQGAWTFKGKVAAPSDQWAIDASVFEYQKQWYMIWSGWKGETNVQQNIYIAKMKNPWTLSGKRVKLSSPDQKWERHGRLPGQHPDHVYVNEGPEILKHHGDLFLIYSANGCWTDYYCLGMLTLENKEDLLDADSWKKSSQPVFKGSKKNSVYAPGHNSFFTSPDGKESWILYHANSAPGQGCGGHRSPRMQRFRWNKDGTPDFGTPVKSDSSLNIPSGWP